MKVVAVGNTVLFLDMQEDKWVEVSRVVLDCDASLVNDLATALDCEFNANFGPRRFRDETLEKIEKARSAREFIQSVIEYPYEVSKDDLKKLREDLTKPRGEHRKFPEEKEDNS